MQSLCVGATRWSAVDGVVEVLCFGLHLTITFFRITYYRKYFCSKKMDIYSPVGVEECAEEASYGIIRTPTSVVLPSP